MGGARGAPIDLVAAALDAHPGFTVLPASFGAHCEPGGLLDLVEGRASVGGFERRLRERWWPRLGGGEAELEAALAEFEGAYRADPLGAAAALFRRLAAVPEGVVPVCRHPEVLPHAQGLLRLFPQARFVHVVAVAPPGGGTPVARLRALAGWAADLRRIESGLRDADDGVSFALPAERFLALRVDPGQPRAALERLAGFLGLEALEPPPAAPATSVPTPPARGPFALAYRLAVARLAREGNHAAELLAEGRGR